MKIIVTHTSPDIDAIMSVWIIRKFLPDWHDAEVQFVQAGETISSKIKNKEVIETIEEDEYVHVDTGLGPLDHHQTDDENISASSLAWDYVKSQNPELKFHQMESERWRHREVAVDRMVKIVVDLDHFKEIFWENPTADYHEFSFAEIIEGLKLSKPNQDKYYIDFGMQALDAIFHNFENRLWAEEEIGKDGIKFETRFGKGIGFGSLNDDVIKLSQKMGYVLVARKDPRKGYVRIKARPTIGNEKGIDLTLVYEKLKKMDPEATWFLHVSKKMLLNGSSKNPKMRPSKLTLDEIIKVLKEI